MFDYNYRVWLIKYLVRICLPPAALVYVLSKTVAAGVASAPTGVLGFFVCLALTAVFGLLTDGVRDWRDSVNAKKLNAQVIPEIRGKRFGNMDLIARYSSLAVFAVNGEDH